MLTHIARNEELWDAFVLGNGGGFLQSWGWAQFQESLGRNVYRYRIDRPGSGEAHEDTVSQFSLIIHPLPLGRRYAYVPRGPVMRAGESDIGARFQTFIGSLRELIGREGLVFARVEFPYERPDGAIGADEIGKSGFRSVRAVQPADTVIIDLEKGEEELLAAMHQKTRYNIRVAERHGVIVREAEFANAEAFRHDVELFWRMLDETAGRDKFHTHPKGYYEKMLDVLSAKKHSGSLKVRLMFAEHKGQAVAAAAIAEYGDTVTYLHGASLSSSRQVMAPYLLHWRIMAEAKRDGRKKYDLWGVAPSDDPAHPWAGITRFKTGFGGARVSYVGAWELPGSAFWYTLYRYAKRFRNV
jgi:lipid II:glycine glycyltransferase (peptidoglycan interpeptide bridge formation enzyme)